MIREAIPKVCMDAPFFLCLSSHLSFIYFFLFAATTEKGEDFFLLSSLYSYGKVVILIDNFRWAIKRVIPYFDWFDVFCDKKSFYPGIIFLLMGRKNSVDVSWDQIYTAFLWILKKTFIYSDKLVNQISQIFSSFRYNLLEFWVNNQQFLIFQTKNVLFLNI